MDQEIVNTDHSGIKYLLHTYNRNSRLAALEQQLAELTARKSFNEIDDLVALYQDAIPEIEDELWSNEADEVQLSAYQRMFNQMEQLLACQESDRRHRFLVVIPVADRPQHLNSCLNSLLVLCQKYQYGGFNGQSYSKVMALIADDSKQPSNIRQHRELAHQIGQQGLAVEYFGLEEQQALVNQLTVETRRQLSHVIGDFEPDAFSHKGASIMRNISYLKLRKMSEQDDHLLFYFIDSDQEFRVKTQTQQGEQDVYGINYFYHLDQIFRSTDIRVLTGKVVGDPPVSPAVMAGNFLEDATGFIKQMADLDAQKDCSFHNQMPKSMDDASYHDMADLFGFKEAADAYQYSCVIQGKHDHSQCFSDFSEKLGHFFDGEHPTRKTYYEHENLYDNYKPARTVYTGNYVFNHKALSYFIPFATLKLRMAGPVLGRMIKADIAGQFVSANLPMLHKRTHEDIGQSEFRPGVKRQSSKVDLTAEFERQFFGDVMLFTMERLTESGYPKQKLSEDEIKNHLQEVEHSLYQKYDAKHRQIMDKLNEFQSIFRGRHQWWHKLETLDPAIQNINQFISNIEYNFGAQSKAYHLVATSTNREKWLQQIQLAIMTYKDDRSLWEKLVLGLG